MSFADLGLLRPFTVGEQTYTGDFILLAVGGSGDLKQDQAENPSWIAYWGAVTASAKEAYDEVESDYRQARDAFIGDILLHGYVEDVDGAEVQHKKVAKTTAEVLWRSHPSYADWWRRQREAERAWNTASYVYEACLRKTQNLTSMTKLYVDELTALARARSAQGA